MRAIVHTKSIACHTKTSVMKRWQTIMCTQLLRTNTSSTSNGKKNDRDCVWRMKYQWSISTCLIHSFIHSHMSTNTRLINCKSYFELEMLFHQRVCTETHINMIANFAWIKENRVLISYGRISKLPAAHFEGQGLILRQVGIVAFPHCHSCPFSTTSCYNIVLSAWFARLR